MESVVKYPTQATYVSLDAPTSNFNGDDFLRCGTGSTTAKQYRTLLQFDLSDIPSYAEIINANLYLYSYSNLCYSAAATLTAEMNGSGWDPATVTYNTKPSLAVNAHTITESGHDKYYVWTDITELVRFWINGTMPNYGFTIYQEVPVSTTSKCFRKTTTNQRPYLVVEYSTLVYIGGVLVKHIYVNGVLVKQLIIS